MSIGLISLGRVVEAEAMARQAIAINPRDRKARFILGISLFAQHKYTDETVRMLRDAAEEFPNAKIVLSRAIAAAGNPEPIATPQHPTGYN